MLNPRQCVWLPSRHINDVTRIGTGTMMRISTVRVRASPLLLWGLALNLRFMLEIVAQSTKVRFYEFLYGEISHEISSVDILNI